MEGSHSPFGFIWQIASETGWSHHRILWKIPYPVLLLMLSDAPRYVTGDKQKKRPGNNKVKTKGQNALDFFQTRLSDS